MSYTNLPPINTPIESPMQDNWQRWFQDINNAEVARNKVDIKGEVTFVKCGAIAFVTATSTSTTITLPFTSASSKPMMTYSGSAPIPATLEKGSNKLTVSAAGLTLSDWYMTSE